MASASLADLLAVATLALNHAANELIGDGRAPARDPLQRLGRVFAELGALRASLDEPRQVTADLDEPTRRLALALIEATRLERERQYPAAIAHVAHAMTDAPLAHREMLAAHLEQLVTPAPDDTDHGPDLLPSQQDLAHAGALSVEQLALIDDTIRAELTTRYQKVAFIVGKTLSKLCDQLPPIPDVFYAQRVIRLVRLGELEAQGDLARMTRSEVRSPKPLG